MGGKVSAVQDRLGPVSYEIRPFTEVTNVELTIVGSARITLAIHSFRGLARQGWKVEARLITPLQNRSRRLGSANWWADRCAINERAELSFGHGFESALTVFHAARGWACYVQSITIIWYGVQLS
jgi:hypothetical protein